MPPSHVGDRPGEQLQLRPASEYRTGGRVVTVHDRFGFNKKAAVEKLAPDGAPNMIPRRIAPTPHAQARTVPNLSTAAADSRQAAPVNSPGRSIPKTRSVVGSELLG
ncbi:hypothetical protein UO65_0968 [Actinokineospora spheciospongiae]|uniref:Uncharacterized protein n=1 Tax=Actinokineospora spheciospongiae TaxID=909613 RepID=W7J3V6_9PSEU|nr:hypothetical protein UO65_0968 [Actinokineospora spheciospongiae]